MTGLSPENDRLLEIAVVVTGPSLEPRVEGPVLVIHQSDEQLAKMDAWNRGTHGRSGLTDKVKASTLTEEQAEAEILAFLRQYVPKGVAPMCGNSIGQDRRFLVRYMPKLEAFFHYRNVDVSTLKELAKRWKPEAYSSFKRRRSTRLWQTFMNLSTSWHITEPTSWPSEKGQDFPALVALAKEVGESPTRAYHRRLHASIAGNPERVII